jgi:hypothetical protein
MRTCSAAFRALHESVPVSAPNSAKFQRCHLIFLLSRQRQFQRSACNKGASQQREIYMVLKRLALALVLCGLALPLPASAQKQGETMHKYVIERDIPGAGRLSTAELNAASKKSREALASMGTNVQWIESYVTDDKLYCVYLAHNEDEIRSHAKAAGIPATRISRVKTILDPTNGN